MNADRARASYARAATEHVFIRRYTGVGANRIPFDYPCRAMVRGYAANEMIEGSAIQQGDRRAVLLYQDLIDHRFPLPVNASTDVLVLHGKEVSIKFVDDATRRLGDELIAYDLQIRG